MSDRRSVDGATTSLAAVLVVTFLASLGTGAIWNGLAFIAKHNYGFEQPRNLLLHAAMGAVYAIGAFQAGRAARILERHIAPRTLLGLIIGSQTALCILPVAFDAQWALWVAACGISSLASFMWPLMESYLTAGRHGPDMRRAIGWFNFTWMPAVVVPMFVMAPILEEHGRWTIAGLAVANLVAIVALRWFSRWPGAHDPQEAAEHVAASYPFLLRSARVLLPLSYVLSSVMSPLLPYRFEQIVIDVKWETPSTATWMIARIVALVIMWRLPFWHGRWGTLLLGAASMTMGFAIVVMAPTLTYMLVGFVCLGTGLGIVYYTALYYAMSVGHAEVDAGGTHEGLIGTGYMIGPLAGLAGAAVGRVTAISGGAAIVGAVWSIMAIGAVAAIRPYGSWRRRSSS